jgi:eukaryotic-like serine/threonine-protein kinase
LPLENWDQIQEYFMEAADLPQSERAAFLDRICGGDAELRLEVESLLRADATGESAVCAAIESEVTSMRDESSPVGERLGPYRVLKEAAAFRQRK